MSDILYGPTKLPDEVWTYELILACALQVREWEGVWVDMHE